ncbi:response regulator [Pedobacter ginsengisoli]|uniref:Response regulator n=1 Tax=Pedobacter ginsengisoli TaxID=363852 RepID=A0A2D1U4U3_9SPHI|nr:response regulator [Pedobacter ginsengisoli]ATP56564.1 response regulator [Pedobacter ginsengisoli]
MTKLIHVVEDDEDIRFIVEYLLTEAGYEVTTSGSAKDFFEKIAIQLPELILLDVMLPDGNGINICRTLKSDTRTGHISIIIMSSHAAERAVLEEACADGFISKPFDLDHMLSFVKQVLNNRDE